MDPKDLLFTNTFIPVDTLDQEQINKDKYNFFPFMTLKNRSINNVEQSLIDRNKTDSDLVRKQRESKPWNQGSLGNQRPTLSGFTRDLVEDSYFEVRKTKINIDSRMRDFKQYAKPNNYEFFLGKKYQNVVSIKLVDYDFKNNFFPINNTNNRITFFTPPPSSFDVNLGSFSLPIANNLLSNEETTKTSYIYPFSFLSMLSKTVGKPVQERYDSFMNNVKKCYFSFKIPPGYYTVNSLKKTIEEYWNQQTYYNSFYLTGPTDSEFLDKDPNEKDLYGYQQLVTIDIDPIKNTVNALLRFEEIKIKALETIRGNNFLEIELDYPTSTFNDLFTNNNFSAIVPTGFPSIGGLKDYQINFVEFFPLDVVIKGDVLYGNQNYYEPMGGNVFRLFFFKNLNTVTNFFEQNVTIGKVPIYFSKDEIITYNCECNLLTNALIGREVPFFFITQKENIFNGFINAYRNCFLSLLSTEGLIRLCESEKDSKYRLFSENELQLITRSIVNTDCSSNLLLTYLGFPFDIEGIGILEPGYDLNLLFAFGINSNLNYSTGNYLKYFATFALLNENNRRFQECYFKKNSNPVPNFRELFRLPSEPPLKLPILKGNDGDYHFYNSNYIFLKLDFDSDFDPKFVQGQPTPLYAYSSDQLYDNYFASILNFKYSMTSFSPPEKLASAPACDNINTNSFENGIIERSIKNVTDLFALIRLNDIPQIPRNTNTDLFDNGIKFYTKQIINLDTFKISFVDYEGKILDLNWDHSLLFEIEEKNEVLKETNISSRNGYVNASNVGFV